jgi:hypothetical protein
MSIRGTYLTTLRTQRHHSAYEMGRVRKGWVTRYQIRSKATRHKPDVKMTESRSVQCGFKPELNGRNKNRSLAAWHLEHDIAPAAVIPQFGLANRGDAAAIQTIPDGNLLVPPVAQPD